MLSYPIDEAIELLDNKLKLAQIAFNNAIEDLENLREQTTITDVNTARIWNFDVKRRRSNVNVNSNDEHE